MAFNRLTTVLLLTAVAASGVFFASRLHQTMKPAGPSTRIVSLYNQFKSKFGRLRASPEEDSYRMKIFEKNVAYIESANQQALGYTLGINDFADMEPEEVKAKYFGLGKDYMSDFWKLFDDKPKKTKKTTKVSKKTTQVSKKTQVDSNYPSSIDWTKDMHPIEHQRGCASCYAFATVVPLELSHFKKTGQKIRLSKQELVDCSNSMGNSGCRGGWMHHSYEYILQRKGLSLEASYPYMASQMNKCALRKTKVESLLNSYEQIPADKPSTIMRHLQTTVVPSAVDVSGLMFYKDGIFSGKCPSSINHAVVIVGYGEENGTPYWKVRNSWGTDWGENGYLRIKRETVDGVIGKCGITVYNVVPL